ncbi:MAG: hypothetical protein HY296_08455 [Thaumarchaeota archaeon]|nr:hypothetical protein [Nitrososphaerota archaeon]
MLSRIRQMVGRTTEGTDWTLQAELDAPEPETPPTAPSPILPEIPNQAEYDPNSNTDHYADLVRLSIDQGGKLGKHEIPVGWLRMTLAGLEGRSLSVEEMWEFECSDSENVSQDGPRLPYDELFPSN